MGQVGQIIYNIEDYAGSGGLISSSRLLDGNIVKSTDLNYERKRIDIYSDNVFKILTENNYIITKIGIQAPPGTVFYLNYDDTKANSQFMVGRTGIYELNKFDKGIKSLRFKKPIKYVLDDYKTQELINVGLDTMDNAKYTYDTKYEQLKLLKASASGNMTNQIFWDKYDDIHKEFDEEYQRGRNEYLRGINGVYSNNYVNLDLNNIIIDFEYNIPQSN